MTLVNGVNGHAGSSSDVQSLPSFPELDGKESSEQKEMLKEMLEKASRLKDGAENFLRMGMTVRASSAGFTVDIHNLQDTVRARVESELEQANIRIDAISRKLESCKTIRLLFNVSLIV